jgi:hypothetical protein
VARIIEAYEQDEQRKARARDAEEKARRNGA